MADPVTIGGGATLLALLAERVFAFFRGDFKKIIEEFTETFDTITDALEKAKDHAENVIGDLESIKSDIDDMQQLIRDSIVKVGSNGERTVELLKELIELTKAQQKDIMEMKLRDKIGRGD